MPEGTQKLIKLEMDLLFAVVKKDTKAKGSKRTIRLRPSPQAYFDRKYKSIEKNIKDWWFTGFYKGIKYDS
jgi:hypothetical protein